MTEKEDFKTRLKIAKKQFLKDKSEDANKKGMFMGSAFRLGTELVAAVVVGTIIGFILDNWFDTKPWFIIIFFFYRSYSWNVKCNKNCEKHAKTRLRKKIYGNKSNVSIYSSQNWT